MQTKTSVLNIMAGVRNTRRARTHLAVTTASVTLGSKHSAPNVSVSSSFCFAPVILLAGYTNV